MSMVKIFESKKYGQRTPILDKQTPIKISFYSPFLFKNSNGEPSVIQVPDKKQDHFKQKN